MPSRPVPSRASEEGSGVTAAGGRRAGDQQRTTLGCGKSDAIDPDHGCLTDGAAAVSTTREAQELVCKAEIIGKAGVIRCLRVTEIVEQAICCGGELTTKNGGVLIHDG